jgi:hypothetical protein
MNFLNRFCKSAIQQAPGGRKQMQLWFSLEIEVRLLNMSRYTLRHCITQILLAFYWSCHTTILLLGLFGGTRGGLGPHLSSTAYLASLAVGIILLL